MYAADSCQYKQHSIRPRKTSYSGICIIFQITQKTNLIISLFFIQKFVILKPVVFVPFLLCFKALFWLFPLCITRENHCFFALCSLHFCFPSFFYIVLLLTRVFQIWSTVATFYAKLANKKLRNVLNELRTRSSFFSKIERVYFAIRWKRKWDELHFTEFGLWTPRIAQLTIIWNSNYQALIIIITMVIIIIVHHDNIAINF